MIWVPLVVRDHLIGVLTDTTSEPDNSRSAAHRAALATISNSIFELLVVRNHGAGVQLLLKCCDYLLKFNS